MTVETILAVLVRVNLVASVAILLVLLLRSLVRRWFGALSRIGSGWSSRSRPWRASCRRASGS